MGNVADYRISFSVDLAPYKQGLEGMLQMTQAAVPQLTALLNLKISTPDMSGIESVFSRVTQETQQYIDAQRQAEQQEQKTGEAGEKAGQQISDGMNKGASTAQSMFFRLGAIQQLLNVVKGTAGEWMSLYGEQVAAETKLATALQTRGVYTDVLFNKLKLFAVQQRDLNGIDDDQVKTIMAQLTAMGLYGDQLLQATKLTEDLSVLMGRDTVAAARVMADAFSGNVGMLGRYIKGLDEHDIKTRGTISIIEQMTRAFGGQAEAAGKTVPIQMEISRLKMEDLKKSWGGMLTDILLPYQREMGNVADQMQSLPSSLQIVTAGVVALGGAFLLLGGIASPWLFAIGGAVTVLVAAKKAIDEMVPPIENQIANMKADDKAVQGLTGSLDKMTDAQKRATVAKLKDQLIELNKQFNGSGLEIDTWGTLLKGVLSAITGDVVPAAELKLTESGKKTLQMIANIKEAIKELEEQPKTGTPNVPGTDPDATAKAVEEDQKLREAAEKRREEMAQQAEQFDQAMWEAHLAALELNLRTQGKTQEEIDSALAEERKARIRQQIERLNSIQEELTAEQALQRMQLEKELTDLLNGEYKQRSQNELEAKKEVDQLIADWEKQQNADADARARERIQQADQERRELVQANLGGIEAMFGEFNSRISESLGQQNSLMSKFLAGQLQWWVNYLNQKLQQWIFEETAETVVHTTAETEKTAATEQGTLARILSNAGEISDIATGAAKMVSAAASAIASAFASIPFPLSIAAAAGAAGLVYGLWEGAKKLFGFKKGGLLTRESYLALQDENGDPDIVGVAAENDQPEIFAPQTDFITAFRDILMPQVLSEILMPQVQPQYLQVAGAGGSVNIDTRGLSDKLDRVVDAVTGLIPHIREGMTIDNKDLVRSVESYQFEQRDRTRT